MSGRVNAANKHLSLDSRITTSRAKYCVIFEDKEIKEIYNTILKFYYENKIVGFPSYEIDKCGGKTAMYDFYERIKLNKVVHDKTIFMCDMDFDFILKGPDYIKYSTNDRFIFLDKYSIENYYINEDVVVNLLSTRIHGVDKDVFRKELKFNDWSNKVTTLFSDLLLEFIQFKLNSTKNPFLSLTQNEGQEEVAGKYNLKSLIDYSQMPSLIMLDHEDYNESRKSIEELLRKIVPSYDYKSALKLKSAGHLNGVNIMDFIPGKILIKLLVEYFKIIHKKLEKCEILDCKSCKKVRKRCRYPISDDYYELEFYQQVDADAFFLKNLESIRDKIDKIIN